MIKRTCLFPKEGQLPMFKTTYIHHSKHVLAHNQMKIHLDENHFCSKSEIINALQLNN